MAKVIAHIGDENIEYETFEDFVDHVVAIQLQALAKAIDSKILDAMAREGLDMSWLGVEVDG